MSTLQLPLATRLTVLFTCVAASVLLGLGVLVAWATERHFVDLDRIYLSDKIHLVEKLIQTASSRAALTSTLDDMLDSHDGLYVQIWANGQLVYGPPRLTQALPTPALPPDQIRDWTYAGQMLRGMAQNLQLTPSSALGTPTVPPNARVLVALDTVHHAHFLHSLRQTLAVYLLLATLVSALLGWWAARRGLSPLQAMRDRTLSITAHNLRARMPVHAVPPEFAGLAQDLNGMFDRLQQDFERLMDFSSDLAHELRTPLSNLLTQTQVALAQPRSADAYREVLASNAEEFERLSKMVADMLFLAKTEHGIDLPHRERIVLQHEVRALFEFYDAVAEDRHIRLVLHGQGEIEGDRLMVRRAISNLLSNALRHAKHGTAVQVQLTTPPGKVCLDVINQGPSIAAADMPKLFDRFYRADPSRTHPAAEGTGLGLAITQAIVTAHGGTITAHSAAGQTCFTISFEAPSALPA